MKGNIMTIYVMGHKNPDTDTVMASIACSELLRLRGLDAKPVVQGEINPESKFVLEKFNIDIPEIINSVEGKNIAIVDTTNPDHLPHDIDKANILFIADHHNLGGLKTASPLEIYAQPVGSSCTILYNIFKNENREIPKNVAGIMMCAIMSDTILFKSPTTTEFDKMAVENLAKITGINKTLELGLEMLKVKSSIENETPIDLINRDLKVFDIKDKKFAIGQIELIDASMAESKKPEILKEMEKLKNENSYHSVILLITDIMKEGSEMLIVADDVSEIENVFNVKCDENHCVWVDGLMSRKKQVVPPLETKI